MRIDYSHQAKKAIARLDRALKRRVRMAIEKLPGGDVKKLKGFSIAYRLRVGDYRVLFDMEGNEIKVTNVLPRGEAYKV